MNKLLDRADFDNRMDSLEKKMDQLLFLKTAKENAAISPEFYNGTLFYSVRDNTHAKIIQSALTDIAHYLSEMDDNPYKLAFTPIELNHYAMDIL